MGWIRIPAKLSGKWQEIRLPYTTPSGTDRIEVLVNVMRQHAKARVWVDDISVIRLPVKPLGVNASPSPSAPKEEPFEG